MGRSGWVQKRSEVSWLKEKSEQKFKAKFLEVA